MQPPKKRRPRMQKNVEVVTATSSGVTQRVRQIVRIQILLSGLALIGAFSLFFFNTETPQSPQGTETRPLDITSLQWEPTTLLVKVKSGVPTTTATMVMERVLGDPITITKDAETGEVVQENQRAEKRLANAELITETQSVAVEKVRKLIPAITAKDTNTARASLGRWAVITVSEPTDIAEVLKRLSTQAEIEYAEPNLIHQVAYAPNDTYYNTDLQNPPVYSWNQVDANGNHFPDLWGLKNLKLGTAWDTTQGSSSTVVAVVDTGVNYTRQDLAGNIWQNTGELGTDASGNPKQSNGVDDDANGYIDDFHGWNAASNDNNPIDSFGHGTHIAGTIAAVTNNAQGVAGVCPQCKIMPVRATLSGSGLSTEGLANGIAYAVDNGAKIINNSWGSISIEYAITEAINYAATNNVMMIFAAGNSAMDANFFYPQAASLIMVAAEDQLGQLASFSNFGSRIDVVAPGVDILSSYGGDMYGDGLHTIGGEYYRASGTSMAAPHVAGVAGLILSQHPTYTPEQVRQVLRTSSSLGSQGQWDSTVGYGMLDASKAVTAATPCVARITAPKDYADLLQLPARTFNISGTANCSALQSYTVEYGTGAEPSTWTTISTSSTPVNAGILAANWDSSVLSTRGEHTLRLTVTDTQNRKYYDYIRIRISFPRLPGYPVYHVGSITIDLSWPNPADLNVDGKAEVHIHGSAFKEDGTGLPGWPITWAGYQTEAIGELVSASPGLEKAIILSDKVTLYSTAGQEITNGWPKPLVQYSRIEAHPVIADLDRDGINELVVMDYAAHLLHVYHGDGNELPGYPITTPITAFAVGDMDPDPNLEIVGLIGDQPYVYDETGALVMSSVLCTYSGNYMTPQLFDMNNDGKLEMVGLNNARNALCGLDAYQRKTVWPLPQTVTLTASKIPIGQTVFHAAGDVNGDGSSELVFAYGDKLYVIQAGGALLPGFPVALPVALSANPLILDVNRDGQMDIVAPSFLGWLFGFTNTGQLIPGFPIDAGSHKFLNFIWSGIAAANVRGGTSYDVFSTNQGISGDAQLQGFRLDAAPGPWMQYQKNGQNVLSVDTDGDGLYDGWEVAYGLSTTGTGGNDTDADGDGLTAAQEFSYGSFPNRTDSDGDGVADNVEVSQGSDPGDPDSPVDTTPPLLKGFTVNPITGGKTISTSTRTWEGVYAQVVYGLTSAYGNVTPWTTTLATSASTTLTGLTPATTYHLATRIKDAAGNTFQSEDVSVTTYSCQESWSCSNWSSCTNGQHTRTCTDANACGTTQNRPILSESCTVPCTSSWSCSPWSSCVSSSQSRTCTDVNSCPTPTNQPALTQACTPPVSCVPQWYCYAWNACTNSTQSRTCVDFSSCNTTQGQPPLSQGCSVATCQENWSCNNWSACTNGLQTRYCQDIRGCGTINTRPVFQQSCTTAPAQNTHSPITVYTISPKVIQTTGKNVSTKIRMYGSGFATNTTVKVGNLPTTVQYISPTELTVTITNFQQAIGYPDISLKNPSTGRTLTVKKTLLIRGLKPAISSTSPATITFPRNSQRERVVIRGKNFAKGVTVQIQGKNPALVFYRSSTLVEIYIKRGQFKRGTYTLILKNADAQSVSKKVNIR